MAARLTDKKKKKIVADYLESGSYRATAKKNGVSDNTVKRIVLDCGDFEQKVAQKKTKKNSKFHLKVERNQKTVIELA